MVNYSLGHLTQPDHQKVGGPIQDDEALLLYALIRVTRIKRILEIGGLRGYSAKNFLEACGPGGRVYSVDLTEVPSQSAGHITICKDVSFITAEDIENEPLDMIFFDCHVYDAQMQAFTSLLNAGLVTDKTILAFHDTNLHPEEFYSPSVKVEGGWRVQLLFAEAEMVNRFKEMGWDIFCFHTDMQVHSRPEEDLPYRWGLTLARRFKPLPLAPI